jgi:hypothetical protein
LNGSSAYLLDSINTDNITGALVKISDNNAGVRGIIS